MSDFLNELFRATDQATKLATAATTESVSVSVEKTQLTDNGPVKEVKEIKDETKQVDHKLVNGPVPYISVEFGATINLGNYSNGKVRVSFHLPVGLEFTPALLGNLEKSFNEAKGWVEKKVEHEVAELSKLRGKV